MMQKPVTNITFLGAALIGCVFTIATTAQAQISVSAALPQGWNEHVSEKGKFSVLAPGIPTPNYRPGDAQLGTVVVYVTNFQKGAQAWQVAYSDLPAPPPDADAVKKLFELLRDKNSPRTVDEKALNLNGHPALEFKLPLTGQGRVQVNRIILVNQRVYEIWVITDARRVASEEVTKFFESFKATPLTDEEIKAAAQTAIADKPKGIPRKIIVSGGVLQGSALKRAQPAYPAEARAAGVSGDVRVRMLISESGGVIEAEVVDGPVPLREAAMAAARMWVFKPTELSGMPVKVEGVLTFKFTLK